MFHNLVSMVPPYRRHLVAAFFNLLIVSPCLAGEPPTIDRLIPSGGQRGSMMDVKLIGKPGDGDLRVISENDCLIGITPSQR